MATWRPPRCCAATGSRGGTDPAASPTASPPRPASPRGSCAPRTWTSRWPRCTSNNSPDTPPNRSWTCCTSTASTASRSGAPAAIPPGYRRQHHHDDPSHDNPGQPRPTGPRVDGGRMPAPGPDRTPRPAAGPSCTAVSPMAGAGTGPRCPPPGVTPGLGRMGPMQPEEVRAQLRGAVYRGDAVAVVAVLRGGRWPPDALQLIGDGLIAAVGRRVPDAAALARACVTELRDRGWDGDDELADQLDGLVGTGPAPLLRPLPVDLEELAGVLEGDPLSGSGRLDRNTGEVCPAAAIEYARETGDEDEDTSEDPDRWLGVHNTGSGAGYRDMAEFIDTVTDPDRADRLGIAIQGRGAFRRL